MIKIKVEPQDFQSVYNEVIVVLDSNNKTEPNFQYVIDVNIDGVYSSRLKVQSNPQGFGIVNLSRHLQSVISHDKPDLTTDEIFNLIPNSFAEYDITLSEEFIVEAPYYFVVDNGGKAQFSFTNPHGFDIGDSINIVGSLNVYDGYQTVTAETSLTLTTTRDYISPNSGIAKISGDIPTITEDVAAVFSATKYVINNVLDFVDVPNWNYEDYSLDFTTTPKFLTNLPTSYYSRLDDTMTLNIRQTESDLMKHLKVVTNLGTYYFENQHAIDISTTKFLSVKVGANDFKESALVVGSSAFPMFDDTSLSYTVQIVEDDFISPTSELRTFTIDRSCTAHENVKLSYLNRGGSFSPFNFAGASEKSIKVKKKSYQQNYGSYNSVAKTYGHNSYDAGTTRLSTETTDKLKLNTTFLPDTIGDLIEDLIISPKVYKIDSDGLTRSVEINTSSVKLKKRTVSKLISYSLDLEYSVNNSNQK